MEQAPHTPDTRYRVHNSYIWLGSLGAVIALLFVLLVTSGGTFISLLADPAEALPAAISLISVGVFMVVVAAIIVVMRLLSYKHLYFTIGQDEFNLFSGIFNKQRVHIPYARIQSIDQHATLLQRIFGVCTVSIDTAGGASNKAVQIPYVTKQQAEWLRSQLFARKMQMEQATTTASAAGGAPTQSGNVLDVGKQVWDEVGGVFAGSYQDAVPVTYEYGLTNKELLLAGISNNTAFAAIIVAILGVVGELMGVFSDQIADEGALLINDVSASISAGQIISGSLAGACALIFGVMLIIWIVGAIASCVNYGGFRARRRGPRIEVERGLLQHTLQGVNIDRVQAVVIKQTFIRRLLGYCELSLARIDAQSDPSESGQSSQQAQLGIVIHPFLKLSRVNEVLSGLVPEYRDVPQEPIALSPKALRRGLIRRCIWQGGGFWCAVCAAIAHILILWLLSFDSDLSLTEAENLLTITNIVCGLLYALAIVIFILDIVGAVLWARGSSFAYNRRFMQVTNAGLSRETVNFPRQKIQYGTVRTNPLQRAAKTATIRARTAAGMGGTTIVLIDVTEEAASAWLDWVRPHAQQDPDEMATLKSSVEGYRATT